MGETNKGFFNLLRIDMEYIVPLFLIFIIVMAIIKISQPKEPSVGESISFEKRFVRETEIELLKVELATIESHIWFYDNQRKTKVFNFPQKYYDWKRMAEGLPNKIKKLETDLSKDYPSPGTYYVTDNDRNYLLEQFFTYKERLEQIDKEMKILISMADTRTKEWYELNESRAGVADKFKFLETKMKSIKLKPSTFSILFRIRNEKDN